MHRYKAHPEDEHLCAVAEAFIKKHPCLREPGSFNGCYGWKQRLKYKMGNYRTPLKVQGCPELSFNSVKYKASADCFPARKVKKPKRAEANFYPSFPTGETVESLEKERLELLTEITIRNNKMLCTLAYRRQEVVNQEPSIKDFKDRWPALFQQKEINAEFQRITAVPLEEKFMAQLDMHSSQLIRVICTNGGATRQKTADIINTLDQNSRADAVRELEQLTMAVFVIRKEGEGLQEPPDDIGIVIEGVALLHGLTSVASACALLLGLIYALNLAYSKTLHFTFKVLQKIIMQLDQHKMSPKVQNLYGRLESLQ
ncbi:uncharacterized protein LOC115018037 [Cottoperca gobio]|uniref:Uncharacterized protein LOC115018037 n=1 Tax=Cottoperca gobio TaxID=56716 RepID=A0A6J2QVT2_COTGO|nr:uncharacterized protein LOC115018037 [Cottoperca gobio]